MNLPTRTQTFEFLKLNGCRYKRVLTTLLAGFVLQFVWNKAVLFLGLNDFQVNLFESAILWIICQEA